MELVVIGSGTVAPSAERTAPAHWVEAGDVRLLFDCGAGVLHRMARLGLPWSEVTHVGLTHFHPDHWGELPMLLFALRWGIEPPRRAPLTLLGPRGLAARLTLLAGAYGDWVTTPDYPLELIELPPGTERPLGGRVRLQTHRTPHTAHSLAYALQTDTARLVYTGDTGPSPDLAAWARGCDLLLAECSLPEERGVDVHLTPTQVGELARAADARHLVLTHFYPVFGSSDPAVQAAKVFGGPVTAARDGDRFSVGTA